MDYSQHMKLEFRRKFLKLFGAAINVHDVPSGAEFGFIEMKAWKLREDIRLYSDSSKQQELLHIHARAIIDFGATYDVFESNTDTLLFSMRRGGLRSTFVRDHWDILGTDGVVIATMQETSGGLALVRRYIGVIPIVGFVAELILMVAPVTYQIKQVTNKTAAAARLIHRKNPFIVKIGLDMTAGSSLDPRVGVAAASLLSVIDAGKN